MKNSILSLFIAVLFLSSCKKDNGPNDGIKYIPSGMFVVNEGQFMGGNASISYFRTNSSYTNVPMNIKCKLLCAGYWILDTGYWMLDQVSRI